MSSPDFQNVKNYFLNLQNTLCDQLSEEDGGASFIDDTWTREPNPDKPGMHGEGHTRLLNNGNIIEQGGVNFSNVIGDKMPTSATANRPELSGRSFKAMGVSLVIHPKNPMIPTSHFNVRFFIAEKEGESPVWWFGGGYDLTPYYGFEEDCRHWHNTAYQACKSFGDNVYDEYKEWCDDYFYIKHRNEQRGIGGLFFDDLNQWGFDKSFEFVQSIGNSFIKAYRPIMSKRKNIAYTDEQRDFQLYRRGRYVEYNLVYDRGTLFSKMTYTPCLVGTVRWKSIYMSK